MQIQFTPMRHANRLSLSKTGDTLTVNGEDFDLSGIPDGATLPRAAVACDWLASDIARVDGVLHLTLILPHGMSAPDETLFPASVTVTGNGPIALPPYEEIA